MAFPPRGSAKCASTLCSRSAASVGGKKWQYLKKVILETIEKTRLEMRRVFIVSKKTFFKVLPLFVGKKVAQKPRGDNFRGHTRKFPKTDAVALLLREKVSVF